MSLWPNHLLRGRILGLKWLWGRERRGWAKKMGGVWSKTKSRFEKRGTDKCTGKIAAIKKTTMVCLIQSHEGKKKKRVKGKKGEHAGRGAKGAIGSIQQSN